jgi:hypothetical protein|nr:MAG TPA: hypothetical protein [Caudoviricetes sp.]
MACTRGSIAAEGLWTPLSQGSRHAGVGAPFFVPSNRNVLVLFRSSSSREGGWAVCGALATRASLQGDSSVPARSLTCHTV